jgi:hypothetical protein
MGDTNCLLCEVDGFPRVGTVHVPGYEFDVCKTHWEGNDGGWDNHYEWIILDHLNKSKIKVPRKGKNGFLPRSYA